VAATFLHAPFPGACRHIQGQQNRPLPTAGKRGLPAVPATLATVPLLFLPVLLLIRRYRKHVLHSGAVMLRVQVLQIVSYILILPSAGVSFTPQAENHCL
jgi:hypothetical protein